MSTGDDFADVRALTNGARFIRGDLHIHSYGGSHDVTDTMATPEAIVQTAVANGLSVIAIADHNATTSVESAIRAASPYNLLVVPAVELSTMQGHLLCYLPDVQRLGQFMAQLGVRDAGTATSRVENSMLDCLIRLQTLDGFGLLAHVDGPKGLEIEMPGAPPHKGDIINHPALLGIELKNANSTISYGVDDPDAVRKGLGRARVIANGDAVGDLARILNSDSHGRGGQGEGR